MICYVIITLRFLGLINIFEFLLRGQIRCMLNFEKLKLLNLLILVFMIFIFYLFVTVMYGTVYISLGF